MAGCREGSACCPGRIDDVPESLLPNAEQSGFVYVRFLCHPLTAPVRRHFFIFPGYEGRHWVFIMPNVRGLLSDADSPLA
jgi:hypothetical protein